MNDNAAWEPLLNLVRSSDLDAIVLNSYQAVTCFAETHLLSQMMLPDRLAFLVVTAEQPVLIVCNIEEAQARAQSSVESIVGYVEFDEDPEVVLAAKLKELGLAEATIGIEARRLPARSRDLLLAHVPRLEIVGVDEDVEELQTVKRPKVCDGLAEAARSTQDAIDATASALGAGATELDFTSSMVAALVRAGGTPVFCFFGSGSRALQGHPEGTTAVLREGTVWRTDVGARFSGGLMSDVARCGTVGAPDAEQARAFATISAAQRAGFAQLKPGAKASDVYAAVAQTILRAGYHWTIPHVGHGLGIGVHEQPILAPSNGMLIEPGMVINIEPILLLPERGEAYHTEDLAVVTAVGHRMLTLPQTELLRVRA